MQGDAGPTGSSRDGPAGAAGSTEARTAAAIDIGSNSIRMVIAQVLPDDRIDVLEQLRQPAPLGHDAFVQGRLSQATITTVIRILQDYQRTLDAYQVEMVRAVATSAVREAANRDALLDRIALTVGLDVEVIEPMEQSRLLVSAVRHTIGRTINLKQGTAMVAEVGGGGTLVTTLREGDITASQSYSLGSIRMRELLLTDREPPRRAADMLRHHISTTVDEARKALGLGAIQTFIAIGGDARFAAGQVGAPIGETDLIEVERDRLDGLIERCISDGSDALTRTYGIPFADAETLVPALLVYQALLQASAAPVMLVSPVSMRDGLLFDLPRYLSGREDPELVESIILSAQTLARKYDDDTKHSEHVADLALHLFDELRREHGLAERHRLLLNVAALVHEIGKFVANRAHHKHGYYLISNSEIFGLRREEIAIVAHVARYHRRSVPKPTHLEYMALPRDQRMVINKLAAILRVADAFDKGHWQQVRDFETERQGQEFVAYVPGTVDLTLERRSLALKGDLFEDMFGIRFRLEEAGQPFASGPTAGPVT